MFTMPRPCSKEIREDVIRIARGDLTGNQPQPAVVRYADGRSLLR